MRVVQTQASEQPDIFDKSLDDSFPLGGDGKEEQRSTGVLDLMKQIVRFKTSSSRNN